MTVRGKILREWANAGFPLPEATFRYEPKGMPIAYREIDLEQRERRRFRLVALETIDSLGCNPAIRSMRDAGAADASGPLFARRRGDGEAPLSEQLAEPPGAAMLPSVVEQMTGPVARVICGTRRCDPRA